MTKSLTTSALSAISKYAYAESLKSLGFKRNGNHLFRPSEDLFHGIHFQASQWGSSEEGKFTINLVVTSSLLYETWTGKPLPRNPASALFPIQQRIGSFMPEHKDHWWAVSCTTDIAVLACEIVHALTAYALPFFTEYPDNAALLGRLRQNKGLPGLTSAQCPLIHAILAKGLGCPEEAGAQIQLALADAGEFPFKTTVVRLGHRIGTL
ncbi:MAG: DUF4304 domain-containing protein [Pontiellaceae bacterium]|jgi:hypothetical protein|nr:DUF4304 domain-containing protein [Pontiellaceae bacterium]